MSRLSSHLLKLLWQQARRRLERRRMLTPYELKWLQTVSRHKDYDSDAKVVPKPAYQGKVAIEALVTRRAACGGTLAVVVSAFAPPSIVDNSVRPSGMADDDLLDAAVTKAGNGGAPVRMAAGRYKRRTPWHIPTGIVIEAEAGALIEAIEGCPTGIEFAPGNHGSVRQHLPALGLFTECGLHLKGTALLNIHIASIGGCCTAVRMTSVNGSLLDNTIRFGSVFECNQACVIEALAATDVIQGNVFSGNFVTTTRSTATYDGTMCYCDGNRFEFEAVDITGDKGGGGFLSNIMRPAPRSPNPNGVSVPRTTFVIKEWAGGDGFKLDAKGGAAQLISGAFNDLIFDIRSTRRFIKENYQQSTSSLIDCDIRLHFASNRNMPFLAITREKFRSGADVGLPAFNDGQPLALDAFILEIRATDAQGLESGKTALFYTYVLFSDVYSAPWEARVVDGDVASVQVVALEDQSQVEDHRLSVVVRNSGSTAWKQERVLVRLERRMN